MNLVLNGINIQFPISQLILSGDKTVETRTYPIPERYLGVDLALIVPLVRISDCVNS